MDYTEIVITVPIENLDQATDIANAIAESGLYIEDYSDMRSILPQAGWSEMIEEELLAKDTSHAVIHMYLGSLQNVSETKNTLRTLFHHAAIPFEYNTRLVKEEDWAENWKQYYKPEHVGTLVIRPSWEAYDVQDGETVVDLDPGMAFGTGQHETTRLCLELLQEFIHPHDRILDMGCGSGILSIAAMKLGAADAVACDRDPDAARTASANALRNGLSAACYHSFSGDILSDSILYQTLCGSFHLVVANIVADTIKEMRDFFFTTLAPSGILIVSGIIDTRSEEIRLYLEQKGFRFLTEKTMRNWVAMVLRKVS